MVHKKRHPRIVIVSRIYSPEPAAASFWLENCAKAFRDRGWDVRVLTSRFRDAPSREVAEGVSVFRAPVLRNSAGYLRGYASYLSFDVPLVFRLLFMRSAELILVEPPPTTGAVVRTLAWLKRIPYVYDAADLWSDAAVTTTDSQLVLRALRLVERFAINGARHAFVVAQSSADRVRAIGIQTPTSVTGFGVDTDSFRYTPTPAPAAPLFVYGGSYSEWHGADIFIRAFAGFLNHHPDARLLYIGNGSERPALSRLAEELDLGDAVEFRDLVPAPALANILSGATASLASLAPGMGYDYAFATKVYASLAVGCPVIFSGVGPTGLFITQATQAVQAGVAVSYNVKAVETAMEGIHSSPLSNGEREKLSSWTHAHYSMRAVANRVVTEATKTIRR